MKDRLVKAAALIAAELLVAALAIPIFTYEFISDLLWRMRHKHDRFA